MKKPTRWESWPPGIELSSSATSPLGAIKLHGYLPDSRGLGQGEGRRLGCYAMVYSLSGRCQYWDELNGSRMIEEGEAFFLFPEVAHRYGGSTAHRWDEMFLLFEGPVFDLWRERGMLDPRKPFLRLEPIPVWRRRIEDCLDPAGRVGSAAVLRQILALQILLVDALAAQQSPEGVPPGWLTAACEVLSGSGAQQIRLPAIARSLGVSFETFRKRFTEIMGVSPGAWRAARMVDAAGRLLADPGMSSKLIAERLGFSDEFHFSRRFRVLAGMTPTNFRKRIGVMAKRRSNQ